MSPNLKFFLLLSIFLCSTILLQQYHLISSINEISSGNAKTSGVDCDETTPRPRVKPNIKRIVMTSKEKADFIKQARDDDYIWDVVMTENQINGATIITTANYAYRNMTLNFIVSLLRTNHTKFVIFCLDEDFLIFLAERGYRDHVVLMPRRWVGVEIDKDLFSENRKGQFDKIMQSRAMLWYQVALRNFRFLFCDLDIVFLSTHVMENVQFNKQYSYAEIFISVGKPKRNTIHNTGFLYAVPTDFTKEFFKNVTIEARNMTDKLALNKIIHGWPHPDHRVVTFDKFLYASGNLHFLDRMSSKHEIKPLMVHASVTPSMMKFKYFKEDGYWYLDENGDEIF
jgi:hypothetical protein